MQNIVKVVALNCLLFLTWLSCAPLPSPGEDLYAIHCTNCHQSNGRGLALLIPPLQENNHLATHFEYLPCIIRFGMSDTVVVNNQRYSESMPGNENLTNIQIANIVNYINTQFAYNKPFLSVMDINKILNDCPNK